MRKLADVMSHTIALSKNENGEDVVTFTVVGGHDIMRWLYHMLAGQCEFGRDARTVLQKLRRKWGPKNFDRYDMHITGGKMRRASIRPRGGI